MLIESDRFKDQEHLVAGDKVKAPAGGRDEPGDELVAHRFALGMDDLDRLELFLGVDRMRQDPVLVPPRRFGVESIVEELERVRRMRLVVSMSLLVRLMRLLLLLTAALSSRVQATVLERDQWRTREDVDR